MRLLLLSDANSPHTIKWSTSLAKRGIELTIFGISSLHVEDYKGYDNINIITLKEPLNGREGALAKIRYLKALPLLKRLLATFRPDILHAHYASSYALLGALSGFHPFIVSVWGSDIFSFPRKSPFHNAIIRFNLSKADMVLSTSHVMARQTRGFTKKEIIVTPFGVDLDVFKPGKISSCFSNCDIVIGTVKALEQEYGIEYLIRAFADVKKKYRTIPLRLLIVGGGSLERQLKELAQELEVSDVTVFTGRVEYSRVPIFQNMLSVFVSVSDSESFGVSAIEASACEKPVVVSNVEVCRK